jgi:aminoglycoside phosphotransferase (APT) family kinase protein
VKELSDLPGSLPPEWRRAFSWLETKLGGRIVRAERQARWRPAWFLDLERDGERVPLYFRGDRGEADHGVYALEHEMSVLQVLEEQGIPVPHVHCFCPEPRGIVMDRSPGRANLATAADDAERESVLDDYMAWLARMHALDVGPFEKAGLARPKTPEEIGLADLDVWERGYRRNKRRPEPAIEFLIRWVRRNVPEGRERVSFLCCDAGQFLFEAGRVTAILDLELACLGDPAADLAGMRCRDLSEPLGDLSRAVRRYEALTGEDVPRSVIDYHTVRFALVTPLAVAHLVAAPPAGIDFVQYLAWYLVYSRTPLEVIARRMGLALAPVELPEASPTRHSQAHDALTEMLRSVQTPAPGEEKKREEEKREGEREEEGDREEEGEREDGGDAFAAYQLDAAARVAEVLRRVDRMGPAIEVADLDDVSALLGRRPESWQQADAALEELVIAAGPDLDAELVGILHRRLLRQEALVDPVLRELRGARIQPLD